MSQHMVVDGIVERGQIEIGDIMVAIVERLLDPVPELSIDPLPSKVDERRGLSGIQMGKDEIFVTLAGLSFESVPDNVDTCQIDASRTAERSVRRDGD